MAYSLKLAQKILDGATRKSLRAEGFRFSQKLFQELRAGPLRALQVVDSQIPKFGLKSNRIPSGSMLLPSGIEATSRYTYRSWIVIDHPARGIIKIIGRFSEDRLLTGKQIREMMEYIGEKAVNEDNLKNRDRSKWVGGRVRRIEILTTLVNDD